jgi:IclR family transcriptional regulator, KDG regulon repressor
VRVPTDRTPRTITDHAALFAELDLVATWGWAMNLEEGQLGVNSVGAPVRRPDGRVMGAVSVVAASHRMRGTIIHQTAGLMVEAAEVISSRLGYRPARQIS